MKCACGGWIVVPAHGTNPVALAVYEHSLTVTHKAWRWYKERTR